MDNESASAPEKQSSKDTVYEYKDAGIQETHGQVPGWLWLVAIVLVTWAIYYTFAYWAPPPA